MADIELDHFGKRRDSFGRRKIETVPGMNFQPRTVGERDAANNTIKFHPGFGRLSGRDSIAPRPGMDLDHRRADLDRGLDLRRIGGDE